VVVLKGKEYLTCDEASEAMFRSYQALSNMRHRNKASGKNDGPKYIRVGMNVLYDKESVDSYMEAIGI